MDNRSLKALEAQLWDAADNLRANSKLTSAPKSINADFMTADEVRAQLQRGYDDVNAGRVYVAAEAFEEFGRKIN